eukprot:tig00020703_g13140.t1
MAPKQTGSSKDEGKGPRWLSSNPSKRFGELFVLAYTPLWIGAVAVLVASRQYENFKEFEYFVFGFALMVPCFIGPVIFANQAERSIPLLKRYSTKSNVWIFIMSWIGNYFWTHYFYNLLGAKYTFPSYRINDVPLVCIWLTHAYFQTYHVFTNMALRRWYTSGAYRAVPGLVATAGTWVLVGAMAYFTAFMETWTISEFPYYSFVNRDLMYKVGSAFYAIYFIVSFPMFIRLDERPGECWTISQTAIDSFACCMIVTCILDAWRLVVGGIVPSARIKHCLPFV